MNLFPILRLKLIISKESSIPSFVNYAANETVIKINFDEQLISKLIVTLNPYKVNCYNGLSIRILQMDSNL